MIMITHDLGIVAEVCDRVAVVYAGEIVEMGDKVHLFDHGLHPYTEGLFHSIPSLTGDETRLKPIKGLPPNPADLPKGCKFAPRCPYASEDCSEAPVFAAGGGARAFSPVYQEIDGGDQAPGQHPGSHQEEPGGKGGGVSNADARSTGFKKIF